MLSRSRTLQLAMASSGDVAPDDGADGAGDSLYSAAGALAGGSTNSCCAEACDGALAGAARGGEGAGGSSPAARLLRDKADA